MAGLHPLSCPANTLSIVAEMTISLLLRILAAASLVLSAPACERGGAAAAAGREPIRRRSPSRRPGP